MRGIDVYSLISLPHLAVRLYSHCWLTLYWLECVRVVYKPVSSCAHTLWTIEALLHIVNAIQTEHKSVQREVNSKTEIFRMLCRWTNYGVWLARSNELCYFKSFHWHLCVCVCTNQQLVFYLHTGRRWIIRNQVEWEADLDIQWHVSMSSFWGLLVCCRPSWLWRPKKTALPLYPSPSLGILFVYINNRPVAVTLVDAAVAKSTHRPATSILSVSLSHWLCIMSLTTVCLPKTFEL